MQENWGGTRLSEICNAAKIVRFIIAFTANEIYSQLTYFLTIVRKNAEHIQENIHGRAFEYVTCD